MRSDRPQSAEERASLLEVGQDVTKDVEEQVGVVISEDQSGAEAYGLVATAPQHQAWKERHGVGGELGARAQSHLLGVPGGQSHRGATIPLDCFIFPLATHPAFLPVFSHQLACPPFSLPSLPTVNDSSVAPNSPC